MSRQNISNRTVKTVHLFVKVLKLIVFFDAIVFLILSVLSPLFLALSVFCFLFSFMYKGRGLLTYKVKKKKKKKLETKQTKVTPKKRPVLKPIKNESPIYYEDEVSFPVINSYYTDSSEFEVSIPVEKVRYTEEELQDLYDFVEVYKNQKIN